MNSLYKISFLLLILAIIACSVRNNEINTSDWKEVKLSLEEDPSFSKMEKQFIIDEINIIINNDEQRYLYSGYTFSQLIDIYSAKYDSLNTRYKSIQKTNAVLDELLELEKAESVSLDSDRGFIIFGLNFNKVFEDSIEYMILTYQYIDDYDNLYFSETSKLSHQAAGRFEGKIQSIMTDIFNGQNEIIYLKTELSAAQVLMDNYGIDESKENLEKEYLKEGLKVMVSAVKFEGDGFMRRRNGDWKYLE